MLRSYLSDEGKKHTEKCSLSLRLHQLKKCETIREHLVRNVSVTFKEED